jgi:hypothetical protein
MVTVYDEEARAVRVREMGLLNGIEMVLVSLVPASNPTAAMLELHLYNTNQVAAILTEIASNPARIPNIFPIFGGFRLPAGNGPGQVHVTSVMAGPAANVLLLGVEPIGDYSTYTLRIAYQNIDPFFNEIEFKFRPGCFTNNCAPEWCPAPTPRLEPSIDYLAKDYDSFKHTLMVAMAQRVPGWQPTSEADFDQVLIDLLAAAADELSDYQDRVMSEAYLGTARKRVSLARHARLMDYHIHQGNQASTWLALEIRAGAQGVLAAGLQAGTHGSPQHEDSEVFVTRDEVTLNHRLNRVKLYTWKGGVPTLAVNSTRADLLLPTPTLPNANQVMNAIKDGEVPFLLLQEHKNPKTGTFAGRDPAKRQLLTLIPERTQILHDPDPAAPGNTALGAWVVRVHWREKLGHTYCFAIKTPIVADDVALFHGNLVQAHHGRPRAMTFFPPDTPLPDLADPSIAGQLPPEHYEISLPDDCRRDECAPYAYERKRGVIARLPEDELLLYRNTSPGGEVPVRSTLQVTIQTAGSGPDEHWDEQPDLVHSDDGAETGDDFVVETDELRRSLMRFGNGVNGREVPADATIFCTWQTGDPLAGNVGADTINGLDLTGFGPLLDQNARVWNPFDVKDGRAPEPAAEIIRRAPEAYSARQLRAVTPADYVRRAEEVPGVARAAARYAWTGSWRTVQISIDPEGTRELDAQLRAAVAQHLEVVRLIGEDLEIRPPIYVPLRIEVALCINENYWPEDVRFVIEQELSDGYTRDGRLGFFHPDRWTFGQYLHASELIGRIQAVEGVDHVISLRMKRWNAASSGTEDTVTVRANEIIRVQNDPDHMEEGSITLDIQGGRQ